MQTVTLQPVMLLNLFSPNFYSNLPPLPVPPCPSPLQNPSVKPAVRSEAAFAKEFPVSSGSQHRKKEEDGLYGEWMPVDKKTDKAGAPAASAGAEDQSKANDSVFPEAPSQVTAPHCRLLYSF